MKIVPCELRDAKEFILRLHRHHAPPVGHRWSLGCLNDSGELCGVAVVGRPVARAVCQRTVVEVLRLCTDGTKNACSMLYAAAARVAFAAGYQRIQTYILANEPGTSLVASGWTRGHIVQGRDWNCPSRGGRRTDQPMCDKVLYFKMNGKAEGRLPGVTE